MKEWVEVEYLHSFLILAVDGDKWSASCPGRFTPGTLCVNDWVRLRDDLGFMDYTNQIFPLLESSHDADISQSSHYTAYAIRAPKDT
jgi:hypothetical protein